MTRDPTKAFRERIDALEEEGRRLADEGKHEAACRRFIAALEIWRALVADPPLPRSGGHAKVVTDQMMSPAVKKRKNLSISETRAPEDAFAAACRAAGYSIRSLAKKLKITPGALFNYRSEARKVPRPITRRIAELTGFADDTDNWPNRE